MTVCGKSKWEMWQKVIRIHSAAGARKAQNIFSLWRASGEKGYTGVPNTERLANLYLLKGGLCNCSQKSSIGDSVAVNNIVTLLLDFRRVLLIVPRTSISSNNQDTSLVSVSEWWSKGGTISLPLIEYWINGNFLFGSNRETCPEVGL